jgi:hypothetical protein
VAQPPYSTRFLEVRDAGAGPTHHTYTVPTGKKAIVRSVDGWMDAAGCHFLFGSTTGVYFLNVIASATLQPIHWTGRQVYSAGEVLDAYNFSGGMACVVSGYLLDA